MLKGNRLSLDSSGRKKMENTIMDKELKASKYRNSNTWESRQLLTCSKAWWRWVCHLNKGGHKKATYCECEREEELKWLETLLVLAKESNGLGKIGRVNKLFGSISKCSKSWHNYMQKPTLHPKGHIENHYAMKV